MEKSKISIIWKASDRRAKGSEIWDSAGSISTYLGYLWTFSVQGHLGVIRCTCDFSENAISKIAAKIYLASDELSTQWSSRNCVWDLGKFGN